MWEAGVQAVGVPVVGVQVDMAGGTVGGLLECGTLADADTAAAGMLVVGTWSRVRTRQT